MQRSLKSNIADIIHKALTVEIQKQLVPMINSNLDTLTQRVCYELTQKLSAFDEMVRENVFHACKNKVISEICLYIILESNNVGYMLVASFIEHNRDIK